MCINDTSNPPTKCILRNTKNITIQFFLWKSGIIQQGAMSLTTIPWNSLYNALVVFCPSLVIFTLVMLLTLYSTRGTLSLSWTSPPYATHMCEPTLHYTRAHSHSQHNLDQIRLPTHAIQPENDRQHNTSTHGMSSHISMCQLNLSSLPRGKAMPICNVPGALGRLQRLLF